MISNSVVRNDISTAFSAGSFNISAGDDDADAERFGKALADAPADSYLLNQNSEKLDTYDKLSVSSATVEDPTTTSATESIWVDTSHYETISVVHTDSRWVDDSWDEYVTHTTPDGENVSYETIHHSAGHWEQYTYTTQETVWVNEGHWESVPTGQDERAAPPPGNTTAVAGTTTTIAKTEFAKLPAVIGKAISLAGIKVVVVKESVVEAFPELKGVTPRGWTKSWDYVPGMYFPEKKTLVFASGNSLPTASVEYRLHEIGHAYDWAMGYASYNDTFKAAWNADKGTLSGYYNQASQLASLEETFAEGFAAYYAGRTDWFSNRPNLLRYFQQFPK